MSNRILLKRTKIYNRKPTASQLEYGEVAINYAKNSEMLFIRNSEDEIIDLSRKEDIEKIKEDLSNITNLTEEEINNLTK